VASPESPWGEQPRPRPIPALDVRDRAPHRGHHEHLNAVERDRTLARDEHVPVAELRIATDILVTFARTASAIW
jgi:hypothetical protein